MVGAGGLMGIRTGVSILLGALINYAILAPIMIQRGDIVPNAKGTIGFREITFWSLWCGVAMMTVASCWRSSPSRKMLSGRPSPSWPAHTSAANARQADVLGAHRAAARVSLIGVPLIGRGCRVDGQELLRRRLLAVASWPWRWCSSSA